MRITGREAIPYPVETVWEALLDPAVLVRTIPGCERLVAAGEHAYDLTVTAGVASIRGSYDGTCRLSDLVPHESLVMRLQGAGAPGTIDATVEVSFRESGGQTVVEYDADATVGGMVGGVGQRLLASVSRRTAGEFFANVGEAIASAGPRPGGGGAPDRAITPGATSAAPEVGRVFTAPARSVDAQQEFRKGIAVGAGLVLLGVLAGSLVGRRRR
ncbi:SRPBCC family protein [Nocardioides cynanchi]|uniref:SRPBCC family protein n=1 Tax=Nocardioides cynanchi TaxID=2558918 RepID=UPI001243CD55|nr:carbon monoxide dehydrogenase subunit G [Nocardioides cynanchi]